MLMDLRRARLARAVPIAGVVIALAGSAPAAASAVDVVPTLTSVPFAATPGRPVKHTISLSGMGAATAVRVTFTTTVGLAGVRASASPGRCPTITALTVVCELGNLNFSGANAAVPAVTITGTVHSGTAPGALVQNLVNVTWAQRNPDSTNNVVSNAYLVPGASAAPVGATPTGPNATSQASSEVAARPPDKEAQTANRVPVLIAMLAFVALAAASLLLARHRHRRS